MAHYPSTIMPHSLPPSDPTPEQVASLSESLPAWPAAARAVARLAAEGAGTRQIAKALAADPVLSGRALRAANCALSAGRAPAQTLDEAVAALGAARIREMADAAAFAALAGAGARLHGASHFFSAGMLRSKIASEAARVCGSDRGDCACAGLLAEIGRLALALRSPERAAAWLDPRPGAEPDPSEELLAETLTEAICRRWTLPEGVCEGVLPPEAAEPAGSARLVVAFSKTALAAILAGDEEPLWLPEAEARLGAGPGTCAGVAERAGEEARRTMAALAAASSGSAP